MSLPKNISCATFLGRRRVIRRRKGRAAAAAKDNTRRRHRRRHRPAAVVFGTAAVSPTRAHVRERHEGKEGRKNDSPTERERERESGITGNKWLLLPSFYSAIPSFASIVERERERRTNLTSIHLWHAMAWHRQRNLRMERLSGWHGSEISISVPREVANSMIPR